MAYKMVNRFLFYDFLQKLIAIKWTEKLDQSICDANQIVLQKTATPSNYQSVLEIRKLQTCGRCSNQHSVKSLVPKIEANKVGQLGRISTKYPLYITTRSPETMVTSRLLQISNHPKHNLYKTNHLFFHFTKLTTLIHKNQGRTPHKLFLQQAPPRGEQQTFFLICSPPPRANIEGKMFVGLLKNSSLFSSFI